MQVENRNDADGDAPVHAVDQRVLQKIENHAHAISLHFMHYNFCRSHQTVTKKAGKPTTPALATRVARAPWSLTQLAELLD